MSQSLPSTDADPLAKRGDQPSGQSDKIVNVVFVRRAYSDRSGPVTDVMDDLARAMRGEGYRVGIVAVPANPPGEIELLSSRALRFLAKSGLPRRMTSLMFLSAALAKLLTIRAQVDIVITVDDPPGVGYVGRLLQGLTRRRVGHVSWVMDLFSLMESTTAGSQARTAALGAWLELQSLRGSCSQTVTIGTCMSEALSSRGVQSSYIPLLATPAESPGPPTNIDQQAPVTLFYGGHIGPRSPLGPLLSAVAESPESLLLSIVGRGPAYAAIHKEWANHPSVALTSTLPWDSYQELARSADVHCVVLGEQYTGMCVPSKAYQAMKMHKPVLYIGSGDGQVAKDVRRAGAGWVASATVREVMSALQQITRDEAYRRGEAGAKFLQEERCPSAVMPNWRSIIEGRRYL